MWCKYSSLSLWQVPLLNSVELEDKIMQKPFVSLES